MHDVTYAIDSFLDIIINIFTKLFNILDSITFHGISLLDFSIIVIITGVIIELFIVSVPNTSINAGYYLGGKKSEYDNKIKKQIGKEKK